MDQDNNMKMVLYHGSRLEVPHPSLTYSRSDVDFGTGFYMTKDEHMAKKWACNKSVSVVNAYELDLTHLRIYYFKPDEEWLNYCIANRYMEQPDFEENKYDVLVGPTADDKLFNTLDMYADGLLSTDEAIKVITCMNYSEQIVIKNQASIDENLHFQSSHTLHGSEKQHFIELFKQDRMEANKRSEMLIKAIKRGR